MKAEPVALTRELPGRTSPFLVAEVRPQVSGIVEELLFTEGGMVEAGQPLYQLEDTTYLADVASAEASLARAEAALKLARLNADRSAELAKADAISRQENENAIAALHLAEADVGVARAEVENKGVYLGYSRIVSPISGYIGRSSITKGALVTANQSAPLATVQQLDPIYVDVTQSSRELLQLRRELAAGTLHRADGTPVTILLEDGAKYQHEGRVAFSEVTVDPTTGSFLLRVVVPNPDNLLLPGMYLRAIIGTGTRDKAILAPQAGVARGPSGGTSAFVVDENGVVEQRAVQVSRTVGNKWLVDGGLQPGDRVVIGGLQKIQPGMTVEAAEANSSAPEAPAPAR